MREHNSVNIRIQEEQKRERKQTNLKKKKKEYMEYMLGCGGEGMVGREVESKTGR